MLPDDVVRLVSSDGTSATGGIELSGGGDAQTAARTVGTTLKRRGP